MFLMVLRRISVVIDKIHETLSSPLLPASPTPTCARQRSLTWWCNWTKITWSTRNFAISWFNPINITVCQARKVRSRQCKFKIEWVRQKSQTAQVLKQHVTPPCAQAEHFTHWFTALWEPYFMGLWKLFCYKDSETWVQGIICRINSPVIFSRANH